MAKKAYILVTKTGPAGEAQIAACTAAGLPAKHATIYEDDLTRRGRRDGGFPERDLMLKQMRPGDVVVIASPGRLGIGKEDVLATLQAIEAKSGSLIDASTGLELRWSPETAGAALFLDRAVIEHKAAAAAAARRVKANAGIKGGRPSPPFLLPEAEVRLRWHNQADYPSQVDVAKEAGKSQRALYRIFGPRSGRANARRKTT